MKDFQKEFRQKTITAEMAVKLVQNDDWVDYGWGIGVPYELDKALAERIVAEDMTGLKFRSGIILRKPFIFDIPNPSRHFCWNSWHPVTYRNIRVQTH